MKIQSKTFRVKSGNLETALHAYEACLGATSTKLARWYVVPADDKEIARLFFSRTILDTFKSLKMYYAKTDAKGQQSASLRYCVFIQSIALAANHGSLATRRRG